MLLLTYMYRPLCSILAAGRCACRNCYFDHWLALQGAHCCKYEVLCTNHVHIGRKKTIQFVYMVGQNLLDGREYQIPTSPSYLTFAHNGCILVYPYSQLQLGSTEVVLLLDLSLIFGSSGSGCNRCHKA